MRSRRQHQVHIGIHSFKELNKLSRLIKSVDIRKILNLSLDANAVRDVLSRHCWLPLLTFSSAASTFAAILFLSLFRFRAFVIIGGGT